MKRILFFSTTLCFFLLILIACPPPPEVEEFEFPENTISLCKLKQLFYEQQLSSIERQFKKDECISSNLVSRLIQLHTAHLADNPCIVIYGGGPAPEDELSKECCNTDPDTGECLAETCLVIPKIEDFHYVTPIELENFEIFNVDNEKRGEKIGSINLDKVKKLENGFLSYSVEYISDDRPRRVDIDFKEKNNNVKYSIKIITNQ